jgi:dihydrofolate reductase
MGIVFLDITTSLDGFIAAPNVSVAQPFGDYGACLHEWLFHRVSSSDDAVDDKVTAEMFANTGAILLGRTMFDVGEESWGDDGAFRRPCFVLTHRKRAALRRGQTTFTFVADGLESGLQQASAAADGKDICVPGGANVVQQCLRAGVIDQLRLHIVPVLFGAGTRLFEGQIPELRMLDGPVVRHSIAATHLVYDVRRSSEVGPTRKQDDST